MSERNGDWIQTFTGRRFWPLDPRPEEVFIEDIAHSLSLQCRYGGHCLEFYSVAEHSVRMANAILATPHLDPALAAWGLLHDASEAYLVDLPRPIKRYSQVGSLYREIEHDLMRVICQRFGLAEDEPCEVVYFDNVMLATEKRDLMAPGKPWHLGVRPLADQIMPWPPQVAESRFLCLAERLLDFGAAPQPEQAELPMRGEA